MVSGVCQKLTSQTLEVSGILKLNLKTKTKIYHEQMSSQNKYSPLQQRINDEMNEKYSPSFQRQEGSTVVLDSNEEYELPKAFIQGGHQQMSSQNKYSLLQQRINDEMNEKYSPSFQRQEGSTVVLDEIDSKEEYKDQRPKL